MNGAFDWAKAVCGVAACGLLMAMPAQAQVTQSGKNQNADWSMGGQDLNNSRNQPTTKISAANVANLSPKWVFTAGGDITATPAVANGIVYFPDLAGDFYALDATTGLPVWKNTVANWTGIAGDYARNDPAVVGNLVILGNQAGNNAYWNGQQLVGSGAYVVAVDANTGALKWSTQVEKFPSAMVTSSPVVYKGVVYVGVASAEEGFLSATQGYPCCTSRGSVVALDVKTGKMLWQTYTIPANNTGALPGYSGGGVWGSTPVVDPKRNSLYVGVGNNYTVPVEDEVCAANGQTNCYDPQDHFDSVLALDLTTGNIKWSTRGWPYDPFNLGCWAASFGSGFTAANCPNPVGPDYDFGGSGPNLFSAGGQDLVGIGQKSGLYWALNADDGSVVWNTQVGPGSATGGIEWGTATDGTRIYVPISNGNSVAYQLQPSGIWVNSGSWAALDPTSGKLLWQTGTPGNCSTSSPSGVAQGCLALSPASVANGVVFAASMDSAPGNPTMFALNAGTGQILWSFAAGSSVLGAPAIVGDSVYWGSGIPKLLANFGFGTTNNKLFAFSVK